MEHIEDSELKCEKCKCTIGDIASNIYFGLCYGCFVEEE